MERIPEVATDTIQDLLTTVELLPVHPIDRREGQQAEIHTALQGQLHVLTTEPTAREEPV